MEGQKSKAGPVVLHLVLMRRWWDEMLDGKKDVEYREQSAHWRRLIWDRRERITHACFSRGYTKATILRPVFGIDTGPCEYAGWPSIYYRLKLGPIIRKTYGDGPDLWYAGHPGEPGATWCIRCWLLHRDEDRVPKHASPPGVGLYMLLCPVCGYSRVPPAPIKPKTPFVPMPEGGAT